MESDKALTNMERAIKAKATKVVYMHRIREYKDYLRANTFTELLIQDKEKTEDSIATYIDWLNGRKLAAKTIRLCMSAIRLFYISNRKELNWEWIHKQVPSVDKVTEDRLYTKEELRKTLDKCDERKRVMFLILYSTGMRIGALPALKFSDFVKIEEYGLYKIKAYAGTKSQYITFCTPECAQAIDGYLQYRRERGEVLKPNSPLIRKQFNRDSPNDVEP
ncbi:MAG TPA: phage integrase N-terminal SAM-like domain-containing protein, partial [Nitrososphaera sp.]